MCKPGFDKLGLSGGWSVFIGFFPLTLRRAPAATVWSGGPMNQSLVVGEHVVVRSVTETSLAREVPVPENSSRPQLFRCVVRADAAGRATVPPAFPIGSVRCPECAWAHPMREPEEERGESRWG